MIMGVKIKKIVRKSLKVIRVEGDGNVHIFRALIVHHRKWLDERASLKNGKRVCPEWN